MKSSRISVVVLALTTSLSGCGGSSDGDQEQQVARAMQSSMEADLTALWQASGAICDAAPEHAWDATADAAAIAAMKAAWVQARAAYEHVEGATAPIFSDIDAAIDARYDDFLDALAPAGDQDLFDDQGVTGMHAIERIIYSDVTPPSVVAAEAMLEGYVPAAFPATEAEATAFKTSLCAKLVADTRTLLDGWTPQQIDVGGAFAGLIGLVNEQQEKVNKAAGGAEESRYAQHTLADLRDNLAGTRSIYGLFRSWLLSKSATAALPSGATIDEAVMQGFARLEAVYAATPGDAIPQPPAGWNVDDPSAGDLATPFGMLYSAVHGAVDASLPDSIVAKMNQGAMLLGIPTFVPEE